MMQVADLSREEGWAERLRIVCLWLFALMPLALLFTRTGAEILMAVIGLSFLAVVFTRRRWAVFAAPILAVLVLLWLYLMAVNTPLAWWEPGRVLGRSVPWLRFFCLFGAVVFWMFRDARDFQTLALVWGAMLAFCVIDGFTQGFFGTSLTGHPVFIGQRLTGPLDRPNIGRFTALLFYPALAAFLIARERSLDHLRVAALALLVLIVSFFIVYTAERGATLLSLATLFLALFIVILLVPRYCLAGIGIMVVALGISYAAVWASARLQIRIAPTVGMAGDFWNSEYGELIRAAVSVWREQPMVGVGLGNFDRVCAAVEPELAFGCLRHPHNIYLEWLAETGIIGLTGFLAFVALVAALALGTLRQRVTRPLAVALAVACPVLTLFPLVPSQSFFSNWPAMLWWSSLSLTCAAAFHIRYREGA